MSDREETVNVIKSLVTERETLCPKCEKAILIRVNPAKNGNTRYKCPVCGVKYRIGQMLKSLPE